MIIFYFILFSIALQSIVPEYGFRSNHVCRHAIGKLLDETVKNKVHITTLYNIQETRALWYCFKAIWLKENYL